MKQTPEARGSTEDAHITGKGPVVDAVGPAFQKIVLAVTADSSGAVHTWTLTAIGPDLSAALSANQCFVVATRSMGPDQGTQTLQAPLFAFQGGVAFADWFLTADVPADGGGATLILKYGPHSVAQLAGQLSSWTSAATFNADPASAQKVLQSELIAIAMNASSTDPKLAALYAPVQQRLNDPTWNGLLVMHPNVVALPSAVARIVTAGPAGVLQALSLGVTLTDATGGVAMAPSLVGSAPFGLIDFENQPSAVAVAGDYRFEVNDIRAQFENGALTSFSALAVMEITSLLGPRVAS
jgi:hypothetical protein